MNFKAERGAPRREKRRDITHTHLYNTFKHIQKNLICLDRSDPCHGPGHFWSYVTMPSHRPSSHLGTGHPFSQPLEDTLPITLKHPGFHPFRQRDNMLLEICNVNAVNEEHRFSFKLDRSLLASLVLPSLMAASAAARSLASASALALASRSSASRLARMKTCRTPEVAKVP